MSKEAFTMEKIIIQNTDFNLDDTFDCGQCFRWEKIGASYIGVAGGRCARLTEDSDKIAIETTKDDFDSFWKYYLDLERDYGQIKKAVSVNGFMKDAVAYGGGIRILKQEFFETLTSFIISQRSSIPKIKSTVKKLCEKYGDELEFDGEKYYSFPTAERLADLKEEDFRALGTGYRAPYLLKAARQVADGEITEEELISLPTPEARKKLMTMYGVGDKVCDCVMLFSLGKYDLFPSDVWIKRVMREQFGSDEKNAKAEGERIFGANSGFAQQYLFYYRRNGSFDE